MSGRILTPDELRAAQEQVKAQLDGQVLAQVAPAMLQTLQHMADTQRGALELQERFLSVLIERIADCVERMCMVQQLQVEAALAEAPKDDWLRQKYEADTLLHWVQDVGRSRLEKYRAAYEEYQEKRKGEQDRLLREATKKAAGGEDG